MYTKLSFLKRTTKEGFFSSFCNFSLDWGSVHPHFPLGPLVLQAKLLVKRRLSCFWLRDAFILKFAVYAISILKKEREEGAAAE